MTWRAWILGLAGVIAICWLVSLAELLVEQAGFLQIPPATLILFALVLGLRAIHARGFARLRPDELATLYAMYLVAALVASRGLMEKLISLLVAPNYFADATNHWAQTYFPRLPQWAWPFSLTGPAQQFVSHAYYEGLRAGEHVPWDLWLRPLAAWSVLVGLVFGSFLCLAVLFRRPWVEHERLAFPLVRLPQQMMPGAGGRLFTNPLMWAGFALPSAVYSINSLRSWFPSLPAIPLSFPLQQLLTSPPWNSLSWTPAMFSFAAVGLLYLVPTDLLLSLWLFFLLTRVQEGLFAGLGMDEPAMPLFPCRLFIGYQVAGAYCVLAFVLLRTAWPTWRATLRAPASDAEGEMFSLRAALWGLAICLVGLCLWSQALGFSLPWALAAWLIYLLVVCLVMARSVAEGGLLATETSFRPADLYAMVAPLHSLGRGNLVGMAVMDAAWFRDQRGLVLTGLMDSLKLGGSAGTRPRTLLAGLCAALVTATVAAAIAQIWLAYHVGALRFYSYLTTGNPLWGFQFYQPHLETRMPPSWQAPVFFAVGTGSAMLLSLLRLRFAGWPLQPLGYALCGSWTMILLWFPCLLTWMIKGAILRYGGRKAYHRLLPLFLGMALGEFAMAVLWTVVAAAAGIPGPTFPWP